MVTLIVVVALGCAFMFAVPIVSHKYDLTISRDQRDHKRCLRNIQQLEQDLFPNLAVEDRWAPWYEKGRQVGEVGVPRSMLDYWLGKEPTEPKESAVPPPAKQFPQRPPLPYGPTQLNGARYNRPVSGMPTKGTR